MLTKTSYSVEVLEEMLVGDYQPRPQPGSWFTVAALTPPRFTGGGVNPMEYQPPRTELAD